MIFHPGVLFRSAAVTVTALLALTGPLQAAAVGVNPVTTTTAPVAVFMPDDARATLAFGLSSITERYLDSISAHAMAVEGLRGLSAIDAGLAVRETDGQVILSSPHRDILALPAPPEDDTEAWARLLVEMVLNARVVSPLLASVDNEGVYQAVFDSVLSRLDHFSRYAGAKEADEQRAGRNGFGGVGIRYLIHPERLEVQEVVPDTPASKAGLQSGDSIIGIDGESVFTIGQARQDFRERLRGPIDSRLTLTINRQGDVQDILLQRGLVVPVTVTLEGLDDGVAHIRISSFNRRTGDAVEEIIAEARDTLGQRFRGILLDLRGNPGGLLDQAVVVADLFMTRGRIVFTRGRHPDALQSYSARTGDIADGLPIAVTLDGGSASAAEIVAAALQDSGRAVVVGSSSYGKGTVQTVLQLPNRGEMTLTWSRFHSPSGYALHGLGVMPTVCVENSSETVDRAINATLAGTSRIPAQLAQWRNTPLEDTRTRQQLRTICPPTDQRSWTVDTQAALRLLSDHALYARALSLTTPQSASR